MEHNAESDPWTAADADPNRDPGPETEPASDAASKHLPTLNTCDQIVANEDISKHTALQVQSLVHCMQLAHLRAQDDARREVEAARNDIALIKLAGHHVEVIDSLRGVVEKMRGKVEELERVVGAQREMLGTLSRSVEELTSIVPRPKRR